MEQDGVMPEEFIWFCEKCQIKGKASGDDLNDIENAQSKHDFASKQCCENVIILKMKDFKESVIGKMLIFSDWRS